MKFTEHELSKLKQKKPRISVEKARTGSVHKFRDKWQAKMRHNGVDVYLGLYEAKELAELATYRGEHLKRKGRVTENIKDIVQKWVSANTDMVEEVEA